MSTILALMLMLTLTTLPEPVLSTILVQDVLYVSEETGVSAAILLHLIDRESGGRYEATRYCEEWNNDGIRCDVERSCYSGCVRRQAVYDNGLDLGLWQLRHSRSWSWIRSYNRARGTRHNRACAYEPECARKVMVHAVRKLREQAKRKEWDCATPRLEEYAWLRHWNGCRSYRKYYDFIMLGGSP